ERQEMAIVFEQGHRLARGIEREIEMSLRPVGPGAQTGIGQWAIEEPQGKLHTKHGAYRPVQVRLRKRAIANAIHEGLLKYVVLEIVELHIDPRLDCQADS